MKQLTEGLKHGDLKNLVLPLISIDEYESKIDESACVFAFYINDIGAAEDLDRFIQRTHIPILDTEISSAPDQHGYYMIFVELLINDQLLANIKEVVSEVSNLADVDKWYIHGRNIAKSIPFNDKNIEKLIPSKKNVQAESVLYLKSSLLETILLEDGKLKLRGTRCEFDFTLVEFVHEEQAMNKQIESTPQNLSFTGTSKSHRLRMALGEDWDVTALGDFLVVKRFDSPRCVVLK